MKLNLDNDTRYVKMSKSIRRTLISLVSQFKTTQNVTPVDFLQQQKTTLDEALIRHFVSLIRHDSFLEDLVNKFRSLQVVKKANTIQTAVMVYFVVFLLDQDNFEEVLEAPAGDTMELLLFLSSEEQYSFFTITACSYFDDSYVVNTIMYPLLKKAEVLKELSSYLEQQELNKQLKIPVTVPQEFHFELLHKKNPPAPPNTSQGSFYGMPSKKVPETNRKLDLRIRKSLKEKHKAILGRAQKLLEQAAKMPQHLTAPKKPAAVAEEPPRIHLKARKVPASLKKDVVIKGNIATTLREAAHFIKEQEDEISRIDDILRGGYNLQKIEALEVEDRKRASLKAEEDIQKKHLQGLITFEEAILAKQKLLEDNRMKSLELKAFKVQLADELSQWRMAEQAKVSALVEKCRKIKTDARESEKKALEKKQMEARIQQHETKQLLRAAEQEKAKELSRKMELIEEIKTLHEVTMQLNQAKLQYDPTEAPNLGLLCEMSVAELNERLALAKLQMNRELQQKRNRIAAKKVEQQRMVEKVKEFIGQTRRVTKALGLPTQEAKAGDSEDVVQLRKLLQQKRSLRLGAA